MNTHLSARTRSRGAWVDGRAARLRFCAPLAPVIAVETAAELKFSESSAVLCFHTHIWAEGSSGHRYFSEEVTVSESWRRASSFTHKLCCALSSWMWTRLLASSGTSPQWRVNQLLTRFLVKIASSRLVSENRHELPKACWFKLHEVHELLLLWSEARNLTRTEYIFHSTINWEIYLFFFSDNGDLMGNVQCNKICMIFAMGFLFEDMEWNITQRCFCERHGWSKSEKTVPPVLPNCFFS